MRPVDHGRPDDADIGIDIETIDIARRLLRDPGSRVREATVPNDRERSIVVGVDLIGRRCDQHEVMLRTADKFVSGKERLRVHFAITARAQVSEPAESACADVRGRQDGLGAVPALARVVVMEGQVIGSVPARGGVHRDGNGPHVVRRIAHRQRARADVLRSHRKRAADNRCKRDVRTSGHAVRRFAARDGSVFGRCARRGECKRSR